MQRDTLLSTIKGLFAKKINLFVWASFHFFCFSVLFSTYAVFSYLRDLNFSSPVLGYSTSVKEEGTVYNVLILGIDRRYAAQKLYRTDVIMLVTVNTKTNKVVLTSIPRDLWANGMKINGVYVARGLNALKEKIKEITGQSVDRFIRVDFDALVWVVDAMGKVTVPVERTFTDKNYPNDREGDANTAITVTFTKGNMEMDGETALIYARSRKGNNGEGSDFARMRRQQILLKAMPEAFLSPRSMFTPFNLKEFYNTITKHVKTDMSIRDVEMVYDLLKDRKKYKVEHFVIDYEYLVNPPVSKYGQWVLIPKNGDYAPIHNKIRSLLE